MGRFTGKVALVTGAARGIGFAAAQRFAADGASVAVLDLDEEAAAQAADQLQVQRGARAIGIGANVTDATSVDTAVDRAHADLGGLDIVVNNAGVTRDNLLFKMTEEDWDIVMAVHLRGAFLVSRAAQRHMVAQKAGAIVNLSSVSALGSRGQANYSAAKAGIQAFTRTLAVELGPFGIRVNAVAPGFVATEMTDATARRLGYEPEEFRRLNADATPVRRVGSPDDIASVISFLAGDEAGFVTGQTIYVDGGQSIG